MLQAHGMPARKGGHYGVGGGGGGGDLRIPVTQAEMRGVTLLRDLESACPRGASSWLLRKRPRNVVNIWDAAAKVHFY